MRAGRPGGARRAPRAALAALGLASLFLAACGPRSGAAGGRSAGGEPSGEGPAGAARAPSVFGSSLLARPGRGGSSLDPAALAEAAAAFEAAWRAAVPAGAASAAMPDGGGEAAASADLAGFLGSCEELAVFTEGAFDPLEPGAAREAARGAALDRAAAEARRLGAGNFLLELGGGVYAGGLKAPGAPWRVAFGAEGGKPAICSLPLRDRAMAVARQEVAASEGEAAEGAAPPKAAYPGIESVAVLAPSALAAEVLARAFLALGPEEWRRLAGGLGGLDALFETEDGFLLASPGVYPGLAGVSLEALPL